MSGSLFSGQTTGLFSDVKTNLFDNTN